MRPIVIHWRSAHVRHTRNAALRSNIRLFVTCKRCRRLRRYAEQRQTQLDALRDIVGRGK